MNNIKKGDVTVIRAVLPNPENYQEILLLHRPGWHKNNAGLWELPGGKLKPGDIEENELDGAKREIEEETGFEVRIVGNGLSLISEYTIQDEERRGQLYVAYAGVARYISGSLEISQEHDAYRWIRPDVPIELNLTRQAIATISLYNDLTLGIVNL